ncbi:hypothetical protein [Corynebacterium pygosceleis]|uniref:hypothetical protein n=1 Tax=Corynebacterium pygosceleis TaxID=2800406 RepID=UPI002004AD68|nr:hypothetical protein [Corynebacterium pygosceleis]MCK7676364.1 hypothetical protein [Corynebacterium pygosceleis]
MPAVGYAVLPITPSLRGLQAEIRSKLQGPVQEASRKAASALEKNMKQGAEAGAAAVEAARRREARAAEQVVKAEKSVEDAKKATELAVKAVEAAEKNLEYVRSSGEAKVIRAEQKLAKLKESGKASIEEIRAAELDLQAVRDKTAGQAIAAEAKVEKARDTAKAKTDAAAASEEKLQKARIQAEDATTNLGTATRRYEESAGAAVGNTGRLSAAMDKVKESASTMGASIAKAAEKYKIHAAVAGGAILALGKSSVDYASEAEQSYGAVESVFSAHAAGIVDQSKRAAEAVGLSGREYRELAAQTGAMMSNMGLPMDEVASKTQNLIGVASDLSATFGGSTKDALEAVNALLRGEADPIEKYGVSIKKSDINARLAAEGLDKLEGSAAKTAETQMLLKMLTEQTSAAQGQFGRETDTAAHKQQVMKAKIDDAREAIGTGLLPIMAQFSDVAARAAEVVGRHPQLFTALAGAFAVLAGSVVALGTIAPIFTAISVAAGAAGMSMGAYVAAQAAAIAPIAAVAAAVAAVVGALYLFFTKTELGKKIWAGFMDKLRESWKWLKETFAPVWDFVKDKWASFMDWAKEVWPRVWETVQSGFALAVDMYRRYWKILWNTVFLPMRLQFKLIKKAAGAVWDGVKAAWGPTTQWLGEKVQWIKEVFSGLKSFWLDGDFTSGLGRALGLEEDSAIVSVAFTIRDGVIAAFQGIRDTIERFRDGFSGLKSLLVDGDFTGAFRRAFGVEEDNPVVDWILRARDAVITGVDAIKAKWDEVSGLFSGMKSLIIDGDFTSELGKALGVDEDSPVISGILDLRDKFLAAVDGIKAKWAEFSQDLAAKYNEHIKPHIDTLKEKFGELWDKLKEFVGELWEPVLKPALEALGIILGGAVVLALGAVVVAIGTVVAAIAAFSYVVLSMPGWISSAIEKVNEWWEKLKTQVSTVIDVLKLAVQGWYDDHIAPLPKKVGDAITGVIGWFKKLPGEIKNQFANAGSWLRDAGRSITAGLLDGLKSGWRNVTNWVREKFSAGGILAARAGGGRVPGYADGGHMGYRLPTSGPGTGRVDGFLAYDRAGMPAARLDAGEWVINRRSSEKYDRELADMNAGRFPKLPGYADGGKHGATVTADMLEEFVKGGFGASKPLEGAPYVWGGVNWGDCSGAMAAIARFAVGLPPFAARFATMTMRSALAEMGFKMGRGGPGTLRFGWFNGGSYGGHTSGTLPNGVNVEMGGNRGNGQIGGGAAGADHRQYTDHAYLPIPSKGELGADILGAALGGDGGYRESVSRQLAPVSQNVSFGSAQEFYEAALLHLRGRTGLYDQGGFLPHGGLALNLSGRPEPVLTNSQWAAFENVARALPGVVEEMRRNNQRRESATGPLGEIARASSAIAAFGTQLGGSFLSNVKIVADAEKGLAETREAVLQDADAIASREKALAEAREELAKVSAESGELSVAATRKIADAEEALAKARSSTGKNRAEKIAAAEKRLARAREDADRQLEKSTDKNAEAQRKALDKVAKAQDELGKVLDRNEDAAIRLEAAERAVAAARFTAAGELVQQGIGFLQKGADAIARFGAEMQRMADIAAQTRQEVSKLQQQQVSLRIAEIQSRHEARVAELNIARVRAQGAVDVARAEAALAKARDGAMVLGETGVNALARSMERFRETGVWAIDMVQAKRTASLQEIAAAEAAVDKARAQAALNNLEAESASQQARLKVLESTLMQAQAAELLRLQTAKLTDQTAQLYGLSQREASGFAKGGQGLGGLLGGLGQIVGALALGGASAATMNPIGIAGAIGMGVSGLAQVIQGGRQLDENKDAFREGWEKLDLGKKIEVGLGIAASGATAIGGGAMALQTQDPRWAQAGFQAAGDISSATFDGFAAEAKRRFDAQTEAMEARIAEAKARFELERLDLEVKKATIDADSAARVDRLRAEIDLAGIREELAKASSKAELKALQEAEAVAATRRDELLAEERKQTALLAAPSPERSARRREPRQVTFQVIGDAVSVDQANRMLAVLNEQYEDLDARVQQIDEDRKPTAFDAVSARRG